MWSILHEHDGEVFQLGPFPTEERAMSAAKIAQKEHSFDIRDQRVYLMHPLHRMQELKVSDVVFEDDE